MAIKYVKKTIVLNQDYVNEARKYFEVKTEKEAVNKALEMILEEKEIIDTHKEIGGTAKIEKYLNESSIRHKYLYILDKGKQIY